MTPSLEEQLGEVSLNGKLSSDQTPFGKEMLKHFSFDPDYRNLNHGSFGAPPKAVQKKKQQYAELCETNPDLFVRYTYPKQLDKSRAAIARVLNADVEAVVFVPNATTGVNIALRSILWNKDGKDEILHFSFVYGGCGNTVDYICEINQNQVSSRSILASHPMEDSALLDAFRAAIQASRAAGKTPRVALYDTVVASPGIRIPFEELTKICKEEGVISLIDGAHGVGHLKLDLTSLDPDFFVSNAHKWLSAPRGCAVFYVALRNHSLIRSSLPTSHGYVPKDRSKRRISPFPPREQSDFINNFEFTGTSDNTNVMAVADGIAWRERVCGGEDEIISYTTNLSIEGGKLLAKILGTEVLDNSTKTASKCALSNVRLPITISNEKINGTVTLKEQHVATAKEWMQETLLTDYKTFVPISYFQGQLWVRMSAQIYLDLEDYEWAGNTLKKLLERVNKEEFLK